MRCCPIAATFWKTNPTNHNRALTYSGPFGAGNFPALSLRPDISYIGISYIGNFSGIRIDHSDVGALLENTFALLEESTPRRLTKRVWMVALS
jgi:hypothetical protein